MGLAQHAAIKNERRDSLVGNFPLTAAFAVEAQSIEAQIVRGIPRPPGGLSLRDLIPFGTLGRGSPKRRPIGRQPAKRRSWMRQSWVHRSWVQLRAGRPGHASLPVNDPVPDRHVLDYRMLEGLRLVFGEIYADH